MFQAFSKANKPKEIEKLVNTIIDKQFVGRTENPIKEDIKFVSCNLGHIVLSRHINCINKQKVVDAIKILKQLKKQNQNRSLYDQQRAIAIGDCIHILERELKLKRKTTKK